jgi:hypothetical protein
MITSAFEGLLVPERTRRKMSVADGSFYRPSIAERPINKADEPFLVTNARRSFVQPAISRDGIVRYGFSECDLEDEQHILAELYRTLWKTSVELGWDNRCSSIAEAKAKLEAFGLEPRTLLVPFVTLHRICGREISLEEARKLIVAQGYIAEVDGIRIFFSYLPEGQMILATAPPLVGVYTRADDHLGLLLRKVNQSIVLINELAR